MVGVLVLHGEVLLYACHTCDGHVLGDFHRIGAPGGHHLASWSNEVPAEGLLRQCLCSTVEPAKFLCVFCAQGLGALCGDDAPLWSLEKGYSHVVCMCVNYFSLFARVLRQSGGQSAPSFLILRKGTYF